MDEGTARADRQDAVVFAATDFSPPSDEAVRQAHERAKAPKAKLVVCHVVPDLLRVNMLFPQRSVEQGKARVELHDTASRALVERTCALTGRKPDEFEAVIDDGTPYASIIDHAERSGAGLIVVGDRGSTGLGRVLLGSVADRVVRYAHCPVLVARAGARTGRVLVASDLSDPSLPALSAAADEAERTGAQVTALHCLEPLAVAAGPEYGVAYAPVVPPEVLAETRANARERLAQAVQQRSLRAEQQVVEGPPAATIVATAEELGADLIVIGTRGRTGVRRVLLGSVAESVVRHAPCSVLVVRMTEAASP